MLNTKKMHVDMKEIVEAINRGNDKVNKRLTETVSMGIKTVPVMAGIKLGSIHIPLDVEDNKKVDERIKKNRKLGIPDGMGLGGDANRFINLDVIATYGEAEFRLPEERFNIGPATNYLDIVRSAGGEAKLNYEMLSDNSDYNDSKLRRDIADKAEVFLMTHFGTYWRLTVVTDKDVSKYLVKYATSIYKSVDKLVDLWEEQLKNGILPEVCIKYERFSNVKALNIIKLIEKNSDTVANAYTGKCRGITLEAVVVDDKVDKNIGARILKSYVEVIPSNAIHGGMNEMLMGDKIHIANIEEAIASDYVCKKLLVSDGIDEYETSFAADKEFFNKHREEPMELLGNRQPDFFKVDDITVLMLPSIRAEKSFIMDNELVHLVIPKNKDYSNSFKAKYI